MDHLQSTLDRPSDHRIPVPSSIKFDIVIHSAVDNFEENDDEGGSLDTIVILFQNPLLVPTENLTPAPKQRVFIIDFMAEACKIESWRGKGKVKTFGDLLIEIWKSFTQMVEHCKRIYFVFNLYLVNSVKSPERQRRAADESTRIVINHINQERPSAHQSNKQPSDFKKFWALMISKIRNLQTQSTITCSKLTIGTLE